MFDEVVINDNNCRIFFDKENYKLYVDYDFPFNPDDYFKTNHYIKIKGYVLYISKPGIYNNGNRVYRVDYYIGFEYEDFELSDLNEITFESSKITELFYDTRLKDEMFTYLFEFKNSKFELILICSNKLKERHYNHLENESCLKINIIQCKDYSELNKIIAVAMNLLSIIAVDIDIKNANINIRRKNSQYGIGNIQFDTFKTKEKYINDYNFSTGNLWYLKDDISKIVNTLYETPNINLYFLSCHQSEYDNYDFFNLYSCFEYEYSKIDKQLLYDESKKEEFDILDEMKKKALLKLSDIDFSPHFVNYIKNYNPFEGHKQKLINGVKYVKDVIYRNFDIEKFNEYINFIYKLRIDIVHNPNNNFIIDDIFNIRNFSEVIYCLLLKRCGIENNVISESAENFFVLVA